MADASWAVALDNVTVARGRSTIFRDLTLEIPAGRVTVLTGSNGAGKSTLLDVIAGIRNPQSGRVLRQVNGLAGYVVQRSSVTDALPLTVRELVSMGRWAHTGPWRRLSARDRAIVEFWLDRLGLALLGARRIGTLSGGQRQRALLGQALAQESRLLLLDEPTSNLDAEGRALLPELLRERAAAGVTVVHATHEADAAAGADLVVRVAAAAPDRP